MTSTTRSLCTSFLTMSAFLLDHARAWASFPFESTIFLFFFLEIASELAYLLP